MAVSDSFSIFAEDKMFCKMRAVKKSILLIVFWLLALSFTPSASGEGVKMWEGTITLPTYRVNAPERAPLFERDFAYQRAKRGVYPYAMNDNPTNDKVDSTHRALFLENDYVKVCVLPDIGGRLFYATDKTDGYEIFYRQSVIKPANVGMLGAWISGGVEWNVFHHHRATSQYPVDWSMVDNGDGSKTIWVGEVENRQGMSWAIGLTLFPDKSYIKVTGRFFNDTPDRNSMLHWNNVATHANENYQIIFPENTDFGTFHHKNSFLRWPVPDGPYCSKPEYEGKDISWWKNLPALMGGSVFAYDLQDDFIGGYDFGKDAGTMLAGDHNINKGGKFWTWGPMNYGHSWDCEILTDEDGPYVELMTGAYSDNQPDYSWIYPYETKEFTAYWYGIRNLRHVNRGNEKATVNMDVSPDGALHLAANVTQPRRNARVEVTRAGCQLFAETVDIAPDKPWSKDLIISAEDAAEPSEVTMRLLSGDGEELISYHPYKKDLSKPLPEDLQPVNPDPSSVENTEELYYLGMRNLQFHQAHVDPYAYFREILRRDDGDTRANTQMGILYRKNGEYDKAASYLRKALKRQTANYTRPSDCEAMYNLGMVLTEMERWEDATDSLYRAAWDYAWASPSYLQLARISSGQGNRIKAMEQVDMAIAYNGMNMEAKNLKVSLLRAEGRKKEALDLAREVFAFDPLNYYAARELVKLGALDKATFDRLLRGQPESYLDLAVSCLNNGFDDEAEAVLLESESLRPYPTTEYYLGYLADCKGDNEPAKSWFNMAESRATDYVFPFRLETVRPLEKALEYCPQSSVTWYYLGNLLYHKQPEKARECWEKAVEAAPSFAMALRNLGWYWRFKDEYSDKNPGDYNKAADYYKAAIDADKDGEALFLTELDEVLEVMNAPLEDRLVVFKGKEDIFRKRYDSETRAIRQMMLSGDYEQVLEPLFTRFYPRREHIEDLHDIYVDACILSGFKAWKAEDNAKALENMLHAAEYPSNHGYAHLEYYARDAQIYYLIGMAYEKTGAMDEARIWYEKAANVEVRDVDAIYLYERALARKKLDPKADIKPEFRHIVECGKAGVLTGVNNFFESFDRGPFLQDLNTSAYLTQGVGYLALGRKGKAAKAFRKSLECRRDNLWANYYLGNIE